MAILHISAAAQNAACNAIVDLLDAGSGAAYLEIYDGTMPATVATAVSTQTLLATLTFSDPAFGDSASGTATASAITSDSSAGATGTAAWARVYDSDDNAILDCNITTTGGGGAIEMNTVAIVAGGEIALTAFTITMPDGT